VKMLEKCVDIVYTNFEATIEKLKYKNKAERVGNPLINGFSSSEINEEKIKEIKQGHRRLVLSYGGSMGAMRVNAEMLSVMKEFSSKNPNVLHIHATGAIESETAQKKFKEMGLDKYKNIQLVEYIYDMPQKMAAADLVICRAGAMTLSELAMLKKPCILIPSPNVTDNHQYKNAAELEKKGAAVVFEEKELSESVLSNAVEKLLNDDKKLFEMQKNIASFAVSNANELIYSGVRKLVDKNKR